MKLKLLSLSLLAATCGLSHGGVIIGGTVNGLTDNTGADLPANTLALLMVDLDGDNLGGGLSLPTGFSAGFSTSVGTVADGDLVAAAGSTSAVFGAFSVTITSPSLDLEGTGTAPITGLSNGDPYYIVWFQGQAAGASDVAPGLFKAARLDTWLVPGDGGNTSGAQATEPPPFVEGAVIPEPASALLLGLASLAFLRRRR